jgi:DNA-directed RNA polymerase subunit RPC12/RpoP
MTTQRRDRRLAWLLLAVAASLVAARLWLLQGLTTDVQIDGGSMAETLPGEHIEFTCAKCSRVWHVDAAQLERAYLACPECGQVVDDKTHREDHAAARVIIDRAAYLLDRPQRFDVVAFQTADSSDLAVKRIVALPGEAWRIEGGEISIGNELVRKSYPQFCETATLVSSSPRRWQAEENSHWQIDDTHWAGEIASDSAEWLTYHHVAAHPAVKDKPAPVQDLDPYNPAVARELNEVRDVVAQCRLTAGAVVLHLRIHDLVLRWDLAAGEVVALRGERDLARARTLRGPLSQARLAWGLCDGRLWLVMNHQMILQHVVESGDASSTPLAIGVSGNGVSDLRDLEVWRDIYYLDPHNSGGQWQPGPLGPGEYALLGDNPPLSIDSRQWERGIPRRSILGKVWPRPE